MTLPRNEKPAQKLERIADIEKEIEQAWNMMVGSELTSARRNELLQYTKARKAEIGRILRDLKRITSEESLELEEPLSLDASTSNPVPAIPTATHLNPSSAHAYSKDIPQLNHADAVLARVLQVTRSFPANIDDDGKLALLNLICTFTTLPIDSQFMNDLLEGLQLGSYTVPLARLWVHRIFSASITASQSMPTAHLSANKTPTPNASQSFSSNKSPVDL
ncbi:hypothetical protein BKA65DRAFT_562815 [Rhexocercosporidium sp. MPI-PUGE-AT-0058]|nr:hypothetical protein BKA65DRAFT_562815 [Rhexocercosporidium sp. MPI-PUGE-AT-0058]